MGVMKYFLKDFPFTAIGLPRGGGWIFWKDFLFTAIGNPRGWVALLRRIFLLWQKDVPITALGTPKGEASVLNDFLLMQ